MLSRTSPKARAKKHARSVGSIAAFERWGEGAALGTRQIATTYLGQHYFAISYGHDELGQHYFAISYDRYRTILQLATSWSALFDKRRADRCCS